MKGSRPSTWRRAANGLLALAARPVRRAQGRHGTVLEAYRGYGSHDEIFLIGRVFRQSRPEHVERDSEIRRNLRDIGRRIRRRRVAGAAVVARFGGAETRVVTDRDGYFRIAMRLCEPPPDEIAWHPVDLAVDTDPPLRGQGQVFIPTSRCRFLLISDIDDTVMHTGVANRLKMLWHLFVADAESRVAFPGVAAFYRALHAGQTGVEGNPMLYVSRAPWGIYDMLSTFFTLHRIPQGPVLFLREWGLSWKRPWPRKAEDHKRALIAHMLALYEDLPVVLIGDSGQHDPEVYARIVEENPGRVLAVYIRNVSREAGRIADVERLAIAVTQAGSSLVLAADSVAMAEHAAGLGLIAEDAVAEVRGERDDPLAVAATDPDQPASVVIK
ncbi:App1 family protein [uncultured Methylobacterium sp.]|uniref:App1 family protein n=1 Tax=uncultured Methylobacterium sp. TaxID=157278 RepID=UPI0035C9ADA0